MNFEPAWAAFYAAIVSALASIGAIVSNFLSGYRSDLRKARRDVIAPTLSELVEGIYSIVARTQQAMDATQPEAAKKKWERASDAAKQLEQVRLKSRLFLGEISDAVHYLILTPRIARHCASSPERRVHVIPLTTELRKAIESVLRKAYVEGRFPSEGETRDITAIAAKIASFFEESKTWDAEAEEDG